MPNTITLEGNGNIVIQDANHAQISIHANDTNALIQFLQTTTNELTQQLLDELAKHKNQVFTNAKNIIGGFIHAGGDVNIGDRIIITERKLPKQLTLQIPTLAQTEIVGREEDLAALQTMLFDNKQVVLVNGLGGIGKTTLAQVYVHKHWDHYQHIAWISQLSDNILFDIANAQGLAKNLEIAEGLTDPADAFNEICRKLNAIEKQPNLLVLDNADTSLEKIHDYLPKQPHWHILITSRQQLNGFAIKELDFLSEEEALALFKSHYQRNDFTGTQIKELINAVDYHTLTIEILAKTADKQRYGFEKLKQALAQDAKANIKIKRPGTDKIERITTFLCSIFGLSQLTETELWLLKQFACLPPEFHPFDLLKELVGPEKSNKAEIFAETLEELSQKGWLLYNKQTDSYKMHRIITEVLKKQQIITIDEIKPLIENITTKLFIDETKDNPIDKFKWLSMGDAVLQSLESQKSYNATIEMMELMDNLGGVYKEIGDFQKSKHLQLSALQISLKLIGEEHQITARLQSNLALALIDLGDYTNAKVLLERAIISDEKNFGTKHPSAAIRYSNLALVLQALGNYSAAKEYMTKSLLIHEEIFGKEHPNTAVLYSNLASVNQNLGNYIGAKELLEKAIKLDEKNFGIEHPITVSHYSNIAIIHQLLGEYSEARVLLEKAMKFMEKSFGIEHPHTTTNYSNLAMVYLDLGDLKKAKELLDKALTIDEKNYGEDHPNMSIRYSNSALLLKACGDYFEAIKLAEKALKSDQNNYGHNHPSIARNYNNLAWIYIDLNEIDKAIELWEKAYPIWLQYLGVNHPNVQIVIKALNKYKK